MNRPFLEIPAEFLRPFPPYEDVFYDQLDECRRHFLPLCSLNLRALGPEQPDEWVHFVSTQELYSGRVGEDTPAAHTRFCRPDQLGFRVIDGKYQFEAGWDYFLTARLPRLEAAAAAGTDPAAAQQLAYARKLADEVCPANEAFYAQEKAHFAAHGRFEKYAQFPLLEDVGYQKEGIRDLLEEVQAEDKPGGELLSADEKAEALFPNLGGELPLDDAGHVLPYVGYLPGYQYQAHGADAVVLFYDPALARAVVCFEYS